MVTDLTRCDFYNQPVYQGYVTDATAGDGVWMITPWGELRYPYYQSWYVYPPVVTYPVVIQTGPDEKELEKIVRKAVRKELRKRDAEQSGS